MSRISRRILAIEESATLAVDAKAKALKAAGEDVIGFGAGEPDFPTPEHIVAAAVEAASKPTNHRYTPAAGLPALRQAVTDATERESHYSVKPAQVLITNGAKHAVYNSFAALLDPGDEVIVPSPYWVTYPEVIRLAGGVPVEVETDETTGFRATVAQLEDARSSRTKAIIFVSPSNPTGAVYPREEMEAVGRWAAENDVWVVSDEIYQHLVYGGADAHSMPAVVPELADRCIVINGVSKTYAMTGWRVGWMIGPPDVIAAAANMQSHATSNVANVSQAAALAALEGGLDCVVAMREAFDRRRQTMYQLLSKIPGVECIEPEGAFYAFPSFGGVLGKEYRGFRPATTLELAGVLLDEVKVAIVPGEAFGAAGYARLSYALGDEQLAEGVARITEFLSD